MRTLAHTAARALALAVVCLPVAAGGASANPPPPANLGVDGGEEVWRPSRSFRIFWTNPPTSPPIVAIHYRVRGPGGSVVVGPVRLPWAASDVDGIEVPPWPSAYLAEVWLEDALGGWSGVASALLRFDDGRPSEVSPAPGATWLGQASFPLPIRLRHPAQVPVSGIRGYAISVSTDPNRLPCAAADRCTETETDLSGGIEADTYVVGELPEGASYLRAAAVSGSGMASIVSDPVALRVDKTFPTTALHGVPADWADRPVTLTAKAVDRGSGMLAEPGGVQPFTAISVDGGAPVVAPGASVATVVAGEGVHQVAFYARDLAGNVDDGGSNNGVLNPPPSVTLVRIDRTAPQVFFAGAQDPAAPELIRARVVDSPSGPATRGSIAVRRRGSGDPYELLPGAPAPPGELRAHWDSEAYRDGEYEFRAIGFDRAGNSTTTQLRAGGAPMVLANPLKAKTSLVAGLAGERSPSGGALLTSRLTVPFSGTALLRGELLAGSRPLASMPVEVVERYGNGVTRVSSVDTAADGSFSIRLAPGPSREVSAVFPGSETLTGATSTALRLAVRAKLRMTTSARTAKVGGSPLRFAGRVNAAPGTIPPEGKTVELQFRLPGLPWTEFRTIRTDRRGRFRYPYRFSDDDSRGVRFLFRAYAPAQGSWPYEPSGSKPVAVRGR